MFAVLFEVEPKPDRWDEYLRHAGLLRPELERIDGFLENRRYRSRRHEGRLISVSFWRDEKSVVRWRTHAGHHATQALGRGDVFRHYHLRVGEVLAEDGAALPQSRLDDTEIGVARRCSVLDDSADETPPQADGLLDWDGFDGITVEGSRLLLLSWRDAAALVAWPGMAAARRRDVRVIRDYGLRDRREAPQYFPAVL